MTKAAMAAAGIAVMTLLASCSGNAKTPQTKPPAGPQNLATCQTSSSAGSSSSAGASSGSGSSGSPTADGSAAGGETGGGLIQAQSADAPDGTVGWQISYCSTGPDGSFVQVTGMVATPAGNPPEGGWPLVAWAHGTQGLGDQCAPSADGIKKIIYLTPWIDAGYAVVATDYAGLGTPGPSSYLVGESEAHAVLDSVRAARSMTDAHIGSQTMVVGYSQGGHAALWTGELAPTYAPDIPLSAVVSLSGPTDMVELAKARFGEVDAFGAAADVVASYIDYFGKDPSQLLTSRGTQVLDLARQRCAGDLPEANGPLDDFFSTPLLDEPDWVSLLQDNSTGQRKIQAPVFMAQAQQDDLVPVDVTRTALPKMCSTDSGLRYKEYNTTHGGLRTAVVDDMTQFLADGLAGKASKVGDDCATVG